MHDDMMTKVAFFRPVAREFLSSRMVVCRASQGVQKVKQDLKATLITNYKVWPAVQVLNFSVVPLKLQVPPCPESPAVHGPRTRPVPSSLA